MDEQEFIAAEMGVQTLIDEYNECNVQDDDDEDCSENEDEVECCETDENECGK